MKTGHHRHFNFLQKVTHWAEVVGDLKTRGSGEKGEGRRGHLFFFPLGMRVDLRVAMSLTEE